MLTGVSTASFYPMQLEEAIQGLGAHGIQTIEIFFNTYSELLPDFLSEINKRMQENEQKVVAVHPFTSGFEPFMLFTGYDRRFQDGLELHRHYFNAMNEIGAKIFVFHGDRKQGRLSQREYFERFAKLRDLGKEYGIIVAQENVERCKSGGLDFLISMVQYLDNDVSLVFDNKQAVRSGIDYHDFIEALGNNIAHMHISDNSSKCDCMALGDGTLDIKEMISFAQQKGFDGAVIIELYRDLLSDVSSIYDSYRVLTSLF